MIHKQHDKHTYILILRSEFCKGIFKGWYMKYFIFTTPTSKFWHPSRLFSIILKQSNFPEMCRAYGRKFLCESENNPLRYYISLLVSTLRTSRKALKSANFAIPRMLLSTLVPIPILFLSPDVLIRWANEGMKRTEISAPFMVDRICESETGV